MGPGQLEARFEGKRDLVEAFTGSLEEVQDREPNDVTGDAVPVDDDVVTDLLGLNIREGVACRKIENVSFAVKGVLDVGLHAIALQRGGR